MHPKTLRPKNESEEGHARSEDMHVTLLDTVRKILQRLQRGWDHPAANIATYIIWCVFFVAGILRSIEHYPPDASRFMKWGKMILFTLVTFGFIVGRLRKYWDTRSFWRLIATLIALHSLVFYAVVNTGMYWSLGLYFVAVIVEIPILLVILGLTVKQDT